MAAVTFQALPNEIIIAILAQCSTRDLVPCASVSRQIYNITTRLVHERLRRAATLPDHDLILECYHPSYKLYTPWLSCARVGTTTRNGELSVDPPERLADVQHLYTTFKIEPSEKQRAERARSARRQTGTQSAARQANEWIYDLPKQTIDIEENVLFFQLCTLTNIVKPGPEPGQFLSHTNVSDGIIRVWRDWLARHEQIVRMINKQWSVFEGDVPDERILWADGDENVGLRCRVSLYLNPYMPLIPPPDYQGSVTYHVYFEELLIRSTRLLFAVEKSEAQEVSELGRALIISTS